MILGLDISTTVAGWAFSNDKVLFDAGFISIDKFDTRRQKAEEIIRILDQHPLIKSINCINLEGALSGFAMGFTRQQTVIMLAKFNAVFEYISETHWKVPVHLVNMVTARKQVLGVGRIKGIKPKDLVRERLPIVCPEIKKFEKMNTKGNPDKKNEDMYDAVLMSLFESRKSN